MRKTSVEFWFSALLSNRWCNLEVSFSHRGSWMVSDSCSCLPQLSYFPEWSGTGLQGQTKRLSAGPAWFPSARLAAILLTEVWQSSSCLPPPAGGFFPFIPTNSQRKHPNKSALFGRLSSQRSFLESQWCQKPI